MADDVYAEMERLRKERGYGPSEALNYLARRGMAAATAARTPYVHTARPMGLRVDLSNIGDVLDVLDADGVDKSR